MSKTNDHRGTVIITIIVILAVAIITILVFRQIYSNSQPTTSADDTGSTTIVDDQSSSESTTDVTTTPADADTAVGDDTPLQYEGTDPNTSQHIEATLTYYGVQNGEYLVNINIPQYLSGTCQISLGDYTGTVAIDQSAASSACSFHIPINRLQSGLQSLEVNIQSSGAAGTIEERIDVNL